jgi:hypothetical protein
MFGWVQAFEDRLIYGGTRHNKNVDPVYWADGYRSWITQIVSIAVTA